MRGRLPSQQHTLMLWNMEEGIAYLFCGIDEIVNAFNVDILDNDPNNCINVLHIDWNDLQ